VKHATSGIFAVGLFAVALGGCSSTSMNDVIGFGGSAPDEREVRVHQVLTMPPDYQLRAPQDGGAEPGQANPYALPNIGTTGAVTASAPESSADPLATDQPAQVATAPADPNAPQSLDPNATPTTTASASGSPYPYGISPNHPDGTPKTSNEINEEMRQRKLEEERRNNPSYGTIWNIGALFE